jgi:ABC-type uncharacterized transport system permease subunit
MRSENEGISIWFFIGTLMLIYGVLIMFYGLYSAASPAGRTTVLQELHADIWWGAVLLVTGVIYSVKFFPRKVK